MLSALIPELKEKIAEQDTVLEVTGLTDDSRDLKRGDLFIAVSGGQYKSNEFIEAAANKSAAAIVCDTPIVAGRVHEVPVYYLENLASMKAEIGRRFYASPAASMSVLGVTGTNGKTSCSHFIARALSNLDFPCGNVGTLGYGLNNKMVDLGLTTPTALKLQKIMAGMLAEGAKAVCIEASSHGLEQNRLESINVDVAVFTNLSRDHLDYHKSLQNYKAAKAKLFQMESLKTAIINFDDDFGVELAESVSSNVNLISYSLKKQDTDVWVRKLDFVACGFNVSVMTPWGEVSVESTLLGEFNVSNVLAVIATLGSMGFSCLRISSAVSELKNVTGRMDLVSNTGHLNVIIDYAHTPDALEKALESLKYHCEGEIWCVFGCGGDRDKGKRPIMGEISTRLAQRSVITTDNPRFEDPQSIVEDIVQGFEKDVAKGVVNLNKGARNTTSFIVEIDRAKAIALALENAKPNDLILIAGKGHEEYQDVNGKRHDFSDYDQVAKKMALRPKMIVGFGATGLACAQYFMSKGIDFNVADDQAQPKNWLTIQSAVNENALFMPRLGEIDASLMTASQLVLSPGVPLQTKAIQDAINVGVSVTGDIAMFAEVSVQPFVAITGTNGKSTVTSLVGSMLRGTGLQVGLGGNIGTPCLELLDKLNDLNVLEVSSYQLEVVDSLNASVAVLLNQSPDHMDRYDDVENYYAMKERVFSGCKIAVLPDFLLGKVNLPENCEVLTFGLSDPTSDRHFGMTEKQGKHYLCLGDKILIEGECLSIGGRHNWLNALAALAVCYALDVDLEMSLTALCEFTGLPHRFETLRDTGKLTCINDSKSTNPNATITAVREAANYNADIILVMGGDAKSADLLPLSNIKNSRVRDCYVYGKDRALLGEAIVGLGINIFYVDDLKQVMTSVAKSHQIGDILLFSPACASQDQFLNFEHRGEAFRMLVKDCAL